MTRRPARSAAPSAAVSAVAAVPPVAADAAVPVVPERGAGAAGGGSQVAEPGAEALAAAVVRLRLARDQLGEIVAMLEQGTGCQDVIARLAVVTRAVDRAGFAVISTGLRECILSPGQGTTDTAAMEKLFLSLA
ncbi:MAG TPA: metal-sensing transcriptional repressor [Ornithinibacter sp.]|nr:metal-sensing transcriptional repressor [Ornithinibacter sp.]